MGFEFKNEEEARDCIERVSILYKRLKSSVNAWPYKVYKLFFIILYL